MFNIITTLQCIILNKKKNFIDQGMCNQLAPTFICLSAVSI